MDVITEMAGYDRDRYHRVPEHRRWWSIATPLGPTAGTGDQDLTLAEDVTLTAVRNASIAVEHRNQLNPIGVVLLVAIAAVGPTSHIVLAGSLHSTSPLELDRQINTCRGMRTTVAFDQISWRSVDSRHCSSLRFRGLAYTTGRPEPNGISLSRGTPPWTIALEAPHHGFQ